ncbi:MAG: hypothetical protein V3T30_02055 [Thermodesulfobacteriota bacterium]
MSTIFTPELTLIDEIAYTYRIEAKILVPTHCYSAGSIEVGKWPDGIQGFPEYLPVIFNIEDNALKCAQGLAEIRVSKGGIELTEDKEGIVGFVVVNGEVRGSGTIIRGSIAKNEKDNSIESGTPAIILPQYTDAWINFMPSFPPMPPSLHVHTKAIVQTNDMSIELTEAVPQGKNHSILLLNLKVNIPETTTAPEKIIFVKDASFDIAAYPGGHNQVSIVNGSQVVNVVIRLIS